MENRFKFYNTLTRNIDTLIPNEEGKIAMLMVKTLKTLMMLLKLEDVQKVMKLVFISLTLLIM